MAIGGTGMAPLACLLQEQGHRVRGTDGPLYPPMSTLLETRGIRPQVGYDPAHLDPRPDLVVVGNAIHRNNPEAVEAERLGLPVALDAAGARPLLPGRPPAPGGRRHARQDDDHRDGRLGLHRLRRRSRLPDRRRAAATCRRASATAPAPRFIIEGDEYNAAYFDRGPKFLHYRPRDRDPDQRRARPCGPLPDARGALGGLSAVCSRCCRRTGCWSPAATRRRCASWRRRRRCRVVFYGL